MAELAIVPARTDPLTGKCTHISATMAGYGQIVLGFRRTCKVPDKDEKFYAPDLGPYLLFDVKKYRGLPRSILQAGGWFIAMRGERVLAVSAYLESIC
ncbi:hypothetical protein IG631_18971 [Alternaria alternata]|nr:hypothetical protein IG631_18971 [Alternaria alternata]